jgi:hypothetical protein
VNRLVQFLAYTGKVFALKKILRRVRDGRSQPRIPLLPVTLCLLLGVVMRIGSYLDLAQQTQSRRRWRHLCGLKNPLDHEVFGYVTERMNPEDWRRNQAEVAKELKGNKALESCKIKGLLFLSIDANEHFASFSRTCPRCCQRQVEGLDPEGQKIKVTQYYHRYVFAHLNGPKFNLVLDVEPIRPGEEECAAALRLLGRIRRLYGPRFFDGITADPWYAKGPFLRALDKLGWLWLVVLKREDMEFFREAIQLSQGHRTNHRGTSSFLRWVGIALAKASKIFSLKHSSKNSFSSAWPIISSWSNSPRRKASRTRCGWYSMSWRSAVRYLLVGRPAQQSWFGDLVH